MAAQKSSSSTALVEAPKRPLCFVIGPIGKDGSSERKHADLLLHTLVKQVLEAEEFGYQVKRADEDADPGMIGDRMVTDIIHADLVVADLTDLNANAFYELGIRHSTEKPTIHIAKTGTMLPFDNVAHRTIFVDLTEWRNTENARAQLAASARAIKASSYRVSNPITQANASFKMRESADPRDNLIADLQERLSSIEQRVSERSRPQRGVSDKDQRRVQSEFDGIRTYIDMSKDDNDRVIETILTQYAGAQLRAKDHSGLGWSIFVPDLGLLTRDARTLSLSAPGLGIAALLDDSRAA